MEILTVLALCVGAATPSGEGVRVEAALGKRRLEATRLVGPAPVIDGRVEDPAWATAVTTTDLVQRRPHPGSLASLPTEVRVLYDERSLFIGLRLHDPEPGSITAPYPRRDDEITSDWVFVEIDSRHDRRTAFSFGVNPRGVQVDGVFFNDTDYDSAWNGVWESAARITADGWEAEFRIPFSQLVYTAGEADEQGAPVVWGLNVYRHNPSRGETSNWSPRLPSLAGIVSNFNELHLRVPARTSRLELMPYVSAIRRDEASLSGGGDLRAGLGGAFTLNLSVHPDFGQVEADPSEVNLTTFETLFTERRPLFVEDAGFFAFDMSLPFATRGNSFAGERAFYSRRVGRAPRLAAPAGTVLLAPPEAATLLGAAKLTGRTGSGWTIGALAALTRSETTPFVDVLGAPGRLKVEPLTQFGVARLTRDFRGGASALGLVATFLGRSGMTPALSSNLARQAFAAGLDGRHRFAHDEYEAAGFVLGGSARGTPEAITRVLEGPGHFNQRPDATHLDMEDASSADGFAAQARLGRIGGEHWRWTLAGRAASPRLELNDVGFQRNADWIVAYGSLRYQEERPGEVFRRWAVGSNQVGAGWSFGGERRAAVVNAGADADLHNYWGGSISLDHELPALQPEALRGGPALLLPSRDAAILSLYTDTRRPSQARLELRAFREPATDSHQVAVAPALDLRPSDRLALSIGPAFDWTTNAWQYVASPVVAERARHVLGRLDQSTVSMTARVDVAFSPRLTLQLYAQPFASRGLFGGYREVVAPRADRVADRTRALADGAVTSVPSGLRIDFGDGIATVADPAYRVRDLNANVVLRWEYHPGSRLYVVWTQERHASPAPDAPFEPAREIADVLDARPTNVFLVKVSHWFTPHR